MVEDGGGGARAAPPARLGCLSSPHRPTHLRDGVRLAAGLSFGDVDDARGDVAVHGAAVVDAEEVHHLCDGGGGQPRPSLLLLPSHAAAAAGSGGAPSRILCGGPECGVMTCSLTCGWAAA